MHKFLDDLQQRLEVARVEQAEIAEYIRLLESLIAIDLKREHRAGSAVPNMYREMRRTSPTSGHTSSKKERRRRPPGQSSPAKEFLLDVMSDGQPWTLDSLKKAAAERQVDFEGKAPGPVLHFTLVGLKRSGQSGYDSKSKVWRLMNKGNAGAGSRIVGNLSGERLSQN
jgi:hypothetical protein